MHIFPKELEIGDYEGFDDNKDIFKRKKFGEGLGNLFANVEDPMVAILDAPWGTGKTTFIKMWCGHMRRRGFPVIYFDAFKNDYMDDAFLAIAGEVIALADDLGRKDGEATKHFLKIAGEVGKASLKGGLKKLASKAFGEEGVEEVLEAVTSEGANCLADSLGDYLLTRLEKRKEERDAFKEFGNALKEIAKDLSEAAPERAKEELKAKSAGPVDLEQSPDRRPLIFVIDELDRCRPPFALEILEKIKHFFSVPNVHFLLVTHMEQLENSVRFAYGMDGEASTYLQKFYHVVITLPDVDAFPLSASYTNRLVENLSEGDSFSLVNYFEIIKGYSKVKKLTLRDQERLITRIALFVAQKPNASTINLDTNIVFGLCVLKVFNQNLYKKLKYNNLSFNDFCSFFNEKNVHEQLKNKNRFWETWACILGDDTLLSSFKDLLRRRDFSPQLRSIIQPYCNDLDSLRL